jgi:hypothetical protein
MKSGLFSDDCCNYGTRSLDKLMAGIDGKKVSTAIRELVHGKRKKILFYSIAQRSTGLSCFFRDPPAGSVDKPATALECCSHNNASVRSFAKKVQNYTDRK